MKLEAMKVACFETRPGNREFLENKLKGHQLFFSDQTANTRNFPATELDIEILSTHTGSKIDRELIDRLPNLKLIATRTTGFDHIDYGYAAERNIAVCNVPFYGENTVAEFAFGLILTLSRKIPDAVNRIKLQKKFEFWGLQGFDLKGKKLGVIGTGHIGAHLIEMGKGFQMEVAGFDAYPNQDLSHTLGFSYLSLEELLGSSDVISIHVPYLPTTHHLLNKDNLAKVKRGAVLVNTARGAVIETAALVEALKSGTLAAAALDVLEDEAGLKNGFEPNLSSSNLNEQLMAMPNVYITPHTAFNTREAEERILQTTVDNINSYLAGTTQNLVKRQ